MRRNADWRSEEWRSEGLPYQTETLYKLWRTCKESWKSRSITLSPAGHQTEGSCWRLQIREDRDNKQGLFVLLHTLTSDLYLFCMLLIIWRQSESEFRVLFSGWFAHAQRASVYLSLVSTEWAEKTSSPLGFSITETKTEIIIQTSIKSQCSFSFISHLVTGVINTHCCSSDMTLEINDLIWGFTDQNSQWRFFLGCKLMCCLSNTLL